MSKKLFLSDLHLGSPLFKHENEVIDLMGSDEYDEIYLVGDTLDTWEADFTSILKKHFRIIQKIFNIMKSGNKKIYIIRGNHDPEIADLKNIFKFVPVMERCEIGGDIVVIHGHQFDHLILEYSWLARFVFRIHWVGERLGFDLMSHLISLYHSIANKHKKKYYDALVTAVAKEAVEKYGHRYKYVVMGHTHLGKIVDGDCTYVNCGSLVYPKKTYVEYDGSKFTLRGFEDGLVYDQNKID